MRKEIKSGNEPQVRSSALLGLRRVYKEHLEHRAVVHAEKHGWEETLDKAIIELQTNGQCYVLDHLQAALWKLMLLEDRCERMSQALKAKNAEAQS